MLVELKPLPVLANLKVRMPLLYKARFAVAAVLIGWAATLIAGTINGIRVDVE